MFWFRLMGIIDPMTQTIRPTAISDARVKAVLEHQDRVLKVLDRELELYRLEADRDIRQ